MADFQANLNELKAENMGVLAGSVDALPEAQKIVSKLELSFPVAHGLDLEFILRALGGYYAPEMGYLQPSGFVIRPSGTVEVASYSSGPVGRVQAANALGMVQYYKQNRD